MTKGICSVCGKYTDLTRKKFHIKGIMLVCEECFRKECVEQVEFGYGLTGEVVGEDMYVYNLANGFGTVGIRDVILRWKKQQGGEEL